MCVLKSPVYVEKCSRNIKIYQGIDGEDEAVGIHYTNFYNTITVTL
jgi:hypothetical protein